MFDLCPGGHVTKLDPIKRASALILNMGPAPREARMALGRDQISDPDGAMEIMELLNDYSRPTR